MTSGSDAPLTGQQERLRVEALAALDRGWCFTPLTGKKPVLDDWPKIKHTKPDNVERWILRGYNIGLITGTNSGITVIDDDSPDGSAAAALGLPPTVSTITGSGKRHYYFAYAEGIGNSAGKLGKNIDVRGDGGQVVFVGSLHPDTRQEYRWAPGCSPSEIPLAPFPTELAARLRPALEAPPTKKRKLPREAGSTNAWAQKALREEVARVAGAAEGERNDTLNRAAFNLGQVVAGGGLPLNEVADALLDAAMRAGLPEKEARATIQSGMRAGAQSPRTAEPRTDRQSDGSQSDADLQEERTTAIKHEPLTDSGNAERLVKLVKGDLRYCYQWNKWMAFKGGCWEIDTSGEAMRRSKEVARGFLEIAAACDSEEIRDAYVAWGLKSEKVDRRKAMVELAKCEAGVAITPDSFDQHPYLLNCGNGTLDLRKFELRAPQREDFLTKHCPTRYVLDARCPQFLAFLERVLPDPEIRQFLQRHTGYSLTGEVCEQQILLAVGGGMNGKSTFFCAVQDVLGHAYAIQVSSELMLTRDHAAHPTELADLFGVRLAIGSESPRGRSLNESLIKLLTGGEPIRARRMREDFWEFLATHKLVLVTNDMPKVSIDSFAMQRRLQVVRFDVRIQPDEVDKRLPLKLRQEREGILAWCVQGCRDWRDRGLDPPAGVMFQPVVGAAHQKRPVEEFISAHVIRRPGARVPAATLFVAFTQWCERHGRPAVSQTELGIALGNEGFGKLKSGGALVYLDTALAGLGTPIQGQLGTVGDSSPVDRLGTPHEGVNGKTIPKCPQPSPEVKSCHACRGTTMWRRSAEAEFFCTRCAPPALGVPVHEVIDTATGEVRHA